MFWPNIETALGEAPPPPHPRVCLEVRCKTFCSILPDRCFEAAQCWYDHAECLDTDGDGDLDMCRCTDGYSWAQTDKACLKDQQGQYTKDSKTQDKSRLSSYFICILAIFF